MRGVDTNVLVRYIAEDDAKQTAVAEGLMEQSSGAGHPLFIPIGVLCELVWVLSRTHREVVRRSLDAFRSGQADFADCVTFDRGLKGAPGFTLLR
jgi:predicted nucleic-acid-binding protein